MKWELEEWRKLYTRVTPAWAALPFFARAMGSELIKYADDQGRIRLSAEPPGDAVARLVAAHRTETKLVKAMVESLLSDGYLIHDKTSDCLVIRNLMRAQERLTTAQRAARYRARKASRDSHANATGSVTNCDEPGDVDRHASEIEIDLPPYPRKRGNEIRPRRQTRADREAAEEAAAEAERKSRLLTGLKPPPPRAM